MAQTTPATVRPLGVPCHYDTDATTRQTSSNHSALVRLQVLRTPWRRAEQMGEATLP